MENSKELKNIQVLLTIIVIPLVIYLLKILSFIFIPLSFALFFALLFSPILRRFRDHKVPTWVSLILISILIFGGSLLLFKLGQLAAREISSADQLFWSKAALKIDRLAIFAETITELELRDSNLDQLIRNKEVIELGKDYFGSTVKILQRIVTMTLMTLFFLILLLSGSINFQELMRGTIFKSRETAIRTFQTIEASTATFIKVKFLISLATGVAFGVACYLFGVSFPLFWGLLAFVLNFIQMIGSIVVTAALAIFAFIEIETTGTWFFFLIVLIGIQILFGSVLEPIFMGQSFKINTIMVLIMLMLWGYLWGIPGVVLSVPITVILKTILLESPNTKAIARLFS